MKNKIIKFKEKEIKVEIGDINKAIQMNHDLYETKSSVLFKNSLSELEKIGFEEFKKEEHLLSSNFDENRFKRIDAISRDGTAIKFLTGRAVTNNEYLSCLVSAGMFDEIKNLVICVFDKYASAKDYEKTIRYLEVIASSKLKFNLDSVSVIELKHK